MMIMTNKKFTSAQFRAKFKVGRSGSLVRSTEESEQASLLKWFKLVYPNMLYTVDLAGMDLTPAQRKVHKTRCKRGHPDMMFQEWFRDSFCGLGLELKRTGEILNESKFKGNSKAAIHLREQMDYIMALRSRQWIAGFVVGRVNAEKVIKHYLEAGDNSLQIINQLIYPKMKF